MSPVADDLWQCSAFMSEDQHEQTNDHQQADKENDTNGTCEEFQHEEASCKVARLMN